MESGAYAYLSNHLEELYNSLMQNLFKKNSSVFSKSIIIIPSHAMQQWLTIQCAQDPAYQIACGLNFQFLHQSFKQINNLLFPELNFFIPNVFELTVKIESELLKIIREEIHPLFEPVKKYLKLEATSKKSERRLFSLSRLLAQLFQNYGNYGDKLIVEWLNDREGGDWQKLLWQRIFANETWLTPIHLINKVLKMESPPCLDLEVHLFSLSSLPAPYLAFFEKLAQSTPIFIYQLSPSKAFWSDLYSDKEHKKMHRFFEKKGVKQHYLENWDSYILDKHALLANWGKLGRNFAHLLEESSFIFKEKYVLNDNCAIAYQNFIDDEIIFSPKKDPMTRLESLQADMLFLRNPEKDKHSVFNEEDTSIQVHVAPTKLREIEILYQNLISLISTSKGKIEPKDILIMAPNMSAYEPYIRAVFENEEYKIAISIEDTSPFLKNAYIEGFYALLDIYDSRFERSSLLKLFANPFFVKEHKITHEECLWLKEWVQEANINWGASRQFRSNWLKEQYPYLNLHNEAFAKTSWEEGLGRTLLEFASNQTETKSNISKISFLEKIHDLLASLEADLDFLHQSKLDLKEWACALESLLEVYFGIDFEESVCFFQFFEKLKNSYVSSEEKFSFYPILELLKEEILAQASFSFTKNIQSIHFCSLLPSRAIPAKVIYMIGMDENSFPRKDSFTSLNRLSNSIQNNAPDKSEFDRYLFLEAILSARSYFIMSFVCNDSSNITPSIIVQELILYLDKCYCGQNLFSQKHVVIHPQFAFNPLYFSTQAYIRSCSNKNYKYAKAALEKEEKPLEIIQKQSHNSNEFSASHAIELKELSKAIRYPLKIYYQKHLNIYLNEDEKDENDLIVSILDKRNFQNESLFSNYERSIEEFSRLGKLPSGLFSQAARLQLQKQHQQIVDFVRYFNISQENIQTLRIDDALPIKGTIENYCPQGWIVNGKNTELNLFKKLPQLICIAKKFHQPQVLFIEDKKALKIHFNNPSRTFEKLAEYYAVIQKKPSYLIPEWINSIIEKDEKKLSKDILNTLENEYKKSYDTYLKWQNRINAIPSAQSIIDEWYDYALELFGDIKNWYSNE